MTGRCLHSCCIMPTERHMHKHSLLQSIIGWWHQKAGVAEEVASMGPAIVSATVDIYQSIKRDLLPTPAKSHYTYNMRDLSKVFQGIAMVGVGVDTPEKMTRSGTPAWV